MSLSYLPIKPSGSSAIGVKSMHMTRNNETPNQYSYRGFALMLVTVFAVADTLTGGMLRESVIGNAKEYTVVAAIVIATIGVYASDGPPGLLFARERSPHKL